MAVGPIKKVKAKIAVKKAQKYSDSKINATSKANAEGAKDFMKKGGSVKKKK